MNILRFIKYLFKKRAEERSYSDEEIKKYFLDLVKCAEIDINSAEIMNKQKEKQYAAIIYHLQQGIEKMIKAELILRKQISIDQVKEVGHKSPHAFMIALFKAFEDREVGGFISDRVPQNYLKEAQKLVTNPNKIINSSKTELLAMLKAYSIYNSLGIPQQVYAQAQQQLPRDRLKRFSKKRADVFMELFFLSWITFPHEALTRYPNNKINPWEYDKTKPIVQVSYLILKRSKSLLNKMKKYKLK
jgi:hypothetical protein